MSERASHRCCRLSALFGASACQVRNGGSTSVNFVIVSTSLSNRVQRPQVCNAGLDLVLAPAFGHTADVHQAITCRGNPLRHELSPVGVRSTTVLAYPSRRPDDPTVLGPRLLGPWCTGTEEGTDENRANLRAVLKYFVGEAPPFRSGVSSGKKVATTIANWPACTERAREVGEAGVGPFRGVLACACSFVRKYLCALRVLSGARACARMGARERSRGKRYKKSMRAAKGSASAAARKSTYKPGSS